MEKTKFKELLLNISICAIACDGDIDEREIEALKNIEKNHEEYINNKKIIVSEKLKKII